LFSVDAPIYPALVTFPESRACHPEVRFLR
jgi:hypothetical protein